MMRQLIIAGLILYLIHIYNPKYYQWITTNMQQIQIFCILGVLLLVYRSNDFDEYTKKTFHFIKKMDADKKINQNA